MLADRAKYCDDHVCLDCLSFCLSTCIGLISNGRTSPDLLFMLPPVTVAQLVLLLKRCVSLYYVGLLRILWMTSCFHTNGCRIQQRRAHAVCVGPVKTELGTKTRRVPRWGGLLCDTPWSCIVLTMQLVSVDV